MIMMMKMTMMMMMMMMIMMMMMMMMMMMIMMMMIMMMTQVCARDLLQLRLQPGPVEQPGPAELQTVRVPGEGGQLPDGPGRAGPGRAVPQHGGALRPSPARDWVEGGEEVEREEECE